MYKFDDDIGKKVELCRKSFGKSASELSLAIGKSREYIHKVEKGLFKPSMTSIVRICEHLNITHYVFTDLTLKNLEDIYQLSKSLKKMSKKERKMVDDFLAQKAYEYMRQEISANK